MQRSEEGAAPGQVALEPMGDSYVMVTCSGGTDGQRWIRTHSLWRMLQRLRLPAVVSTYAAYESLLVEFDPLRIDASGIQTLMGQLLRGYSEADEQWLSSTCTYRLPVIYGGDVLIVAEQLGMTVGDFVDMHSSEPLRITCRAVGGSFMMSSPPCLPEVARLKSPIARVAKVGEINIAGRQCSLSLDSGPTTTGWLNIGWTPADLRPARNGNGGFQPGDELRIEPLLEAQLGEYCGAPVPVSEAPC